MRRRLGCAALLAAVFLLGACSTPPRPISSGFSGRWALTVQSDPPSQYSAQFEWQGDARAGELWLTSPLGSTLARLSWNPSRSQLTQAGRVQTADTPEQLLRQLVDVDLPLATLHDWLQGRPTPLAGWQVDVSDQVSGRLVFTRLNPLPVAQLRIALDR